MSEYWKSTPKYWCKHCSLYVRDTKFERTQHDATPRHQGNLKRFLRDLHRGTERAERDAQRAKDEVARLNRLSGSAAAGPASGPVGTAGPGAPAGPGSTAAPWKRKPAAAAPREATPAERKAQLAQLAALGVAIPDEFRNEMAMAGDWQTVSERVVYDMPDSRVKKEDDDGDGYDDEDEEDEGYKPGVLASGKRKRGLRDADGDGEGVEKAKKKVWGSTFKTFPGADEEKDLEKLLTGGKKFGKGRELQPGGSSLDQHKDDIKTEQQAEKTSEPSVEGEDTSADGAKDPTIGSGEAPVKTQNADAEGIPPTGVFFKKRKQKASAQK